MRWMHGSCKTAWLNEKGHPQVPFAVGLIEEAQASAAVTITSTR